MYFLKWILIGFWILFPGISNASAWLVEPKKSNLIITNYVENSNLEIQNNSLEIYYEYGIFNNLSLIVEQAISFEKNYYNFDEGFTALKFGILKSEHWVSSLQLGLIGDFSSFNDIGEIGFESKILVGRGFDNGTWVNLEFARRNCDDNGSNRFEATIGKNLKNNDKIIFKNFSENDACAAQIKRSQFSYVKNFGDKISIEIGARINYSNKFSDDINTGFILGLWKSF